MAPERRTARRALIAAVIARLAQWLTATMATRRTRRPSCRFRLHRSCDTFKDMKTSTLPPLRVEPRLRSQAERLLRAGETLSSFIVDAVEERVRNRAMEDEFIKRGLASAERARR